LPSAVDRTDAVTIGTYSNNYSRTFE